MKNKKKKMKLAWVLGTAILFLMLFSVFAFICSDYAGNFRPEDASEMYWRHWNSKGFWYWSIIPSVICGLICLGITALEDRLDYISLSRKNGYTRVLLEVYDEDGYRNINELELNDIRVTLERLGG